MIVNCILLIFFLFHSLFKYRLDFVFSSKSLIIKNICIIVMVLGMWLFSKRANTLQTLFISEIFPVDYRLDR